MSYSVSASGKKEAVKADLRAKCEQAVSYGQMSEELAARIVEAVDAAPGTDASVSAYGHIAENPANTYGSISVSASSPVVAVEEAAGAAPPVGVSGGGDGGAQEV